jgi:hypothetical protein
MWGDDSSTSSARRCWRSSTVWTSVAVGKEPNVSWDDGVDDPPYDPEAPFTTEHPSAAVIEHHLRQCQISNEVLDSHELDAALLGEIGFDWLLDGTTGLGHR